MECSQCTPEMFSKETQLDIFEIFECLKEVESKEVECGCGIIKISKINDKLKIEKIITNE